MKSIKEIADGVRHVLDKNRVEFIAMFDADKRKIIKVDTSTTVSEATDIARILNLL